MTGQGEIYLVLPEFELCFYGARHFERPVFFWDSKRPLFRISKVFIANHISPQSHSCEPAHAPKQSFYHFIDGAGPG